MDSRRVKTICSLINEALLNVETQNNKETTDKASIRTSLKFVYACINKLITLSEKDEPTVKKTGIIKMLYSEDIDRLFKLGFTSIQIATITGIINYEIEKYLRGRKLIK